MTNLSTHYLRFELKNPLVVSSSPLTENLENIRRMEDAGASAIVLHSLFEEQVILDGRKLNFGFIPGEESYSESLNSFPDMKNYNLGPEGYLEHIQKAKKSINIPLIASLNATSKGNWVSYARQVQQAGADAIELNIYFIPIDTDLTGTEIEQRYLDILRDVRSNVTIPIAVKLNPFFSSIPNMAKGLDKTGADALVLFNRFYLPDFDLNTHDVTPFLTLSNSNEVLLRMHWIAILYGNIQSDLAVTGGIHTAKDVVKCIMAGASVTMMTSALLKFGIEHISTVLSDLQMWLKEHEYESITQMRGKMSRKSVKDASVFEHVNYARVIGSYNPRGR